MTQPELGRKIADLRKAKGLTQEELVEKCNLNVRTLQRIESGEVTPRSYTIKIIFSALDCNIYDSSKHAPNRFKTTELVIKQWLGQFYKYVIDLFNLKTNTMKKLMILSVPFVILCVVLAFSFSSNMKAQEKTVIREKFEKTSSQSKFIQWFNAGQMDSISMQYHVNACMMPDDSPTIVGRESIKKYYKGLFDLGLRFKSNESQSKVITDNFAIDRGTWSIEPLNMTGTYLTQWHYINGTWFIENEMTKADKMINTAEIK